MATERDSKQPVTLLGRNCGARKIPQFADVPHNKAESDAQRFTNWAGNAQTFQPTRCNGVVDDARPP